MSDNSISFEIMEQIKEYRSKLEFSLKDIKNVKSNMEYDMFKFAAISFVCIFFFFIVVHSTIKTINVYKRQKKAEHDDSGAEAKKVGDENIFSIDESDTNYKTEIERNINKSTKIYNKNLANVKLEKKSSNKDYKDVDVDQIVLESEININALDSKNDDNNYESLENVKSSNFWDLMFIKNEYENA
jgi:hypothetical protein